MIFRWISKGFLNSHRVPNQEERKVVPVLDFQRERKQKNPRSGAVDQATVDLRRPVWKSREEQVANV